MLSKLLKIILKKTYLIRRGNMPTKKLLEIIVTQFNIDEKDITLETSFRDDLNADSLDLVELVMGLEDEFDLEIDDEDVEKIKTVGDAVDYIKNIVGEDN